MAATTEIARVTARDQILGRLRAAQASLRLPAAEEFSRAPRHSASLDECAARFVVEAAALGVECFVELSPDAVRDRLAALVGDGPVLSWDPEYLPYDIHRVLNHAVHGRSLRDEQARMSVGVTGCDAAIADTGSLVLFSGPGRSRAVSLLPPLHVAIVRREQLCFSLNDVFDKHGQRLDEAPSCTVITGPSRTADIELTLTLGIHGPARVVVILGP